MRGSDKLSAGTVPAADRYARKRHHQILHESSSNTSTSTAMASSGARTTRAMAPTAVANPEAARYPRKRHQQIWHETSMAPTAIHDPLVEPEIESSDSNDEVKYDIKSLSGTWRDNKDNTYEVCVDDDVKIKTRRPGGDILVTRGMSETLIWRELTRMTPINRHYNSQTSPIRCDPSCADRGKTSPIRCDPSCADYGKQTHLQTRSAQGLVHKEAGRIIWTGKHFTYVLTELTAKSMTWTCPDAETYRWRRIVEPEIESSDSNDEVKYDIKSLSGTWKDNKDNTYEVCVDDDVKIKTRRPGGDILVTRGMSELIWRELTRMTPINRHYGHKTSPIRCDPSCADRGKTSPIRCDPSCADYGKQTHLQTRSAQGLIHKEAGRIIWTGKHLTYVLTELTAKSMTWTCPDAETYRWTRITIPTSKRHNISDNNASTRGRSDYQRQRRMTTAPATISEREQERPAPTISKRAKKQPEPSISKTTAKADQPDTSISRPKRVQPEPSLPMEEHSYDDLNSKLSLSQRIKQLVDSIP